MTGVFTKLEGDTVILHSKGVFKQADVYERRGFLYARHAGGFIRVIDKGRTSIPHISWEDLEIERCEPVVAEFGRLKL